MSEWTSVIAVYWALWAVDGARWAARRGFSIINGARHGAGRVWYERWMPPPLLPTRWRLTTADPPLSLSPVAVSNLPRGSAGRPAETPAGSRVWRWEEIRQVGVAKGWIFINDQPFCPDTGHVSAREFLTIARKPPVEREHSIRTIIRRWFRPAHLRRRQRVLVGRTSLIAACNALALTLTAGLSAYVVLDLASNLAEEQAAAIARLLPFTLAGLLLLHVTGVTLAWRALRRLRSLGIDRRRGALFSALLLPPQALKLRALLADGIFPATHPLAAIVAFAGRDARATFGFHVLADLRWPLAPAAAPPLATAVSGWFTAVVDEQVTRLLHETGLEPASLLRAPAPDSPASCRYCPRCHDQFAAGPPQCPQGIELLPLDPRPAGIRRPSQPE